MNSQYSEWTFRGKPFILEEDSKYEGFVYCLTNRSNGKKYIGKKNFWRRGKKPPLKGKKRKRSYKKESDWQTYCGSSEEVKKIIEEDPNAFFDRQIIRLCESKGEMNYYEAYEQFTSNALLLPDEYYNAFIGCKINRSQLNKLLIKTS